MLPIYLAYFTCICTAAAGVLGDRNKCQIFTNDNPCPPGNELLSARCGRGLMECVPCREGYTQCDFSNSTFPVKCYRIACPEMEKGVTVARLTWNEDKRCRFSCVCNEARGYTGTTSNNCSLHKQPCGVDKQLKDGSCIPCEKGYHNADPKFGRCVPDDVKAPMTKPSSSTNYTVPVVVAVVAVVAIVVMVLIACIKSGKINIACCGRAIQESKNSDREGSDRQGNAGDNPYSDANGNCPNGTAGQSNMMTGHQHTNGGHQTSTSGQANGFAGHSTDAQTDGTVSWNKSLDPSGTIGESEDPNKGTMNSTIRSQAEYSIRALPQAGQAPQYGQGMSVHDVDATDVTLPSNLLGSSLSGLTTRSADIQLAAIFDPEHTEQKVLLSSVNKAAVVSCEANETCQPLLDNHSSQAFGELDINSY